MEHHKSGLSPIKGRERQDDKLPINPIKDLKRKSVARGFGEHTNWRNLQDRLLDHGNCHFPGLLGILCLGLRIISGTWVGLVSSSRDRDDCWRILATNRNCFDCSAPSSLPVDEAR